MVELFHLIAQWLLSPAGILLVTTSLLLVAAAIHWSPNRNTFRFLALPLLLWAAFSAWSALDSSSPRSALAGVLWGFGVMGVYALALAPLVAAGKSRRTIAVVSAVLFAVQLPLSLLAGLYLGCYVGHDCP